MQNYTIYGTTSNMTLLCEIRLFFYNENTKYNDKQILNSRVPFYNPFPSCRYITNKKY